MARSYKTLGQVAIAVGATPENLYTVPGGKMAVLSNIQVNNKNAAARTIRIWIRSGGVAAADKHLVVYEYSIAANSFASLQFGVTMAAADIVTIQASATDVSFSAFGFEEDI